MSIRSSRSYNNCLIPTQATPNYFAAFWVSFWYDNIRQRFSPYVSVRCSTYNSLYNPSTMIFSHTSLVLNLYFSCPQFIDAYHDKLTETEEQWYQNLHSWPLQRSGMVKVHGIWSKVTWVLKLGSLFSRLRPWGNYITSLNLFPELKRRITVVVGCEN